MKSMDTLRFGTGGIPLSVTRGGLSEGIREINSLGLGSMEMEFVRQVYLKEDKTLLVKELASQYDVVLTSHASYYINLNSSDPAIRKASVQRLLQSARITAMCGGYSTCVHAAYYQKDTHQQVLPRVKEYFKNVLATLRDEGHEMWVRPETGGKINQFADSYDLISFAEELDGVLPCFDFAHQYSRTLGKWNTTDEFRKLLSEIEKKLGKSGLYNMHIHMEGIEFTDRGERNHVNLDECPFRYHDLLKVWKEFGIRGVVTCESPNLETDALFLQKFYKSL